MRRSAYRADPSKVEPSRLFRFIRPFRPDLTNVQLMCCAICVIDASASMNRPGISLRRLAAPLCSAVYRLVLRKLWHAIESNDFSVDFNLFAC